MISLFAKGTNDVFPFTTLNCNPYSCSLSRVFPRINDDPFCSSILFVAESRPVAWLLYSVLVKY